MKFVHIFSSILFLIVIVITIKVIISRADSEKTDPDISSSPNTITLKIGSSQMDVSGEKKELDPGRGTTPIILDGRTMIPIRALVEEIGGRVHWLPKENIIIVITADKNILLRINSNTITVNSKESQMDVAPQINNSRTIVPVRFLLEQLNFCVEWLETSQEIKIVQDVKIVSKTNAKAPLPSNSIAAPTIIDHLNSHSLTYAQGPDKNPLKGLFPFKGNYSESTTIPYSMEYASLPLNSIMTGYSTFDWTSLENILNEVSSRGRHIVFRFYIDNPSAASGLPQFLVDDGVTQRSQDKDVATDYDNPKLLLALDNLISEFGAKYDGDPRLGFVQMGLIGYWGEWHTYPHDWMQSELNQHKIIDDFQKAFKKTKILIRNPDTYLVGKDIGYHDDSFSHSTLPAPYATNGAQWMFFGRVLSTNCLNTWKTSPIGGEVRPEVQSDIWSNTPPSSPISQDYNLSVDMTHISWAICHEIFAKPLSTVERERAIEGSRRMGYEYTINKVYFKNKIDSGSALDIQVAMKNTGVAPFYYDWKVQLALKDDTDKINTFDTTWQISQVIPMSDKLFTQSIDTTNLTKGKYTIMLKVLNPLPNGIPLCFANKEQDNITGWLNLGEVDID